MTASPSHFLARLRGPGSPTHLALVRALFAAHVVTVLGSSVVPMIVATGATPHPQAHTSLPGFVEAWLQGDVVLVARLVGLVAATFLLVGLATRAAAIATTVAFLVTQHLWFRATVFHDDWLYFTFFLLVLSCAPAGDAWSVDAWLARRRGRTVPRRDPQAYRWPIELMIAWFAFVYVAGGLAKVFPIAKGALWLQGTSTQAFAIEFAPDSPVVWLLGHTPFDYTLLWPWTLAAVATVVLELGAVALVLTRRAYLPVYVGLLGMHVTIWWLGIPGFVQIVAVAGVLLLPPAGFARLDARLPTAG